METSPNQLNHDDLREARQQVAESYSEYLDRVMSALSEATELGERLQDAAVSGDLEAVQNACWDLSRHSQQLSNGLRTLSASALWKAHPEYC